MKLGSDDISKVYIGSTEIQKVYLGSSLVWEACALTSFMMSASHYFTLPLACAGDIDTERWHDGIAAYPKDGDIIYDDCGITVHSGHATRHYNLGNGYTARIGVGTGIVSNRTAC